MSKKKYAVFTMDVEAFSDTECISYSGYQTDDDRFDGFDEYIELLDRYNIKSTLFTVGNIAPKIYERLNNAIQSGHELALHSFEHSITPSINPDTFKEKLIDTKEKLGRLFNTEVCGFRAPFFSMDNEHLGILKEAGFKYDSSHLGFLRARHTVNIDFTSFNRLREGIHTNDGFFEFSMSMGNILGIPYPISGGGYIRLADWNFAKAIFKNYISKHDFYVFYLHPFELSSKKPPLIKGLKSYDKYYLKTGLSTYKKHIEEMILHLKKANYEFVTFNELAAIMEE